MLTIEKSECLPPPRPRSPAFIDTLSSCLRDGTQESYLSIFFFFFQNHIYCIWSRLVQNTLHDSFSKTLYLLRLLCGRKISCFLEKVSAGNKILIWSLSMNMNKVCWSPILFIYFFSPFESFLFRFCSRVIISWYIYRNYGVQKTILAYLAFSCAGKNKKVGKTGRKNTLCAFWIGK